MGFIDTMRAEGHAVESICRVLREQGCQVAARTYRSWKQPDRHIAERTVTDAQVIDAIRDLAWGIDDRGRRKLTAEGLYGRRKMTALLRRTTMPNVGAGAVDRAMRALDLVGVRRDKKVRTTIPAKRGKRAGDLLDRDFTAEAPNRTWVTDFTYCRTWTGFVYAFIVDVFAQRIVAWHASTSKETGLVMTPLRMALWQREREGQPRVPGELICHSDAGSPSTPRSRSQSVSSTPAAMPRSDRSATPYDNALAESQIGLYKSELIDNQPWRNRGNVEIETLDWVHWFNTERTHESIDDLTPIQVEQVHYTHRTRLAEAS